MGIRSFAGLIEAYLVTLNYLADFVSGIPLTGNAKALPFGISGPKELDFDDYEPPKDAYNNTLKGKKKIDLTGETFEASPNTLAWVHYLAQSGCEMVAVSEGCTEYEGDGEGVPSPGSGIYWKKNATGGIFFFSYPARTHVGLDYEYRLSANSQSINLMLSMAVIESKAKTLIQNSKFNIIRKDAVVLPNYDASKQFVSECKQLRIISGGSYVDVFAWDEIEDRNLIYKTVSNKKPVDNRSLPNLMDISLEVTGVNADVDKINQLLAFDKFAKINLTEETPSGTLIQHYFNANTLSNTPKFKVNKDKRTATFSVAGETSIKRFTVDSDNNTVTVG